MLVCGFHGTQIFQNFVICIYLDWKLGSLKVLVPFFELGFNDEYRSDNFVPWV